MSFDSEIKKSHRNMEIMFHVTFTVKNASQINYWNVLQSSKPCTFIVRSLHWLLDSLIPKFGSMTKMLFQLHP
jgi:hypothetical protein